MNYELEVLSGKFCNLNFMTLSCGISKLKWARFENRLSEQSECEINLNPALLPGNQAFCAEYRSTVKLFSSFDVSSTIYIEIAPLLF